MTFLRNSKLEPQVRKQHIEVPVGAWQCCIFQPLFLWRVVQWASRLEWDHCDFDQSHPQGISWAELLLDFCCATNTKPPVNLGARQGRGCSDYQLPDISSVASLQCPTFQSMISVFANSCKFFLRCLHVQLFPAACRPVDALHIYGHVRPVTGLDRRPRLIQPHLVHQLLFDYTSGSHRQRRDFNACITLPQVLALVDPSPPAQHPLHLIDIAQLHYHNNRRSRRCANIPVVA